MRTEFVYKWRVEIQALIKLGIYVDAWRDVKRAEDFIEGHARPELEYHVNTYWEDIWSTLRRDYRRIFNITI